MSYPRPPSQSRLNSRARSQSPLSRPTTPLRTSSRTSFRNSQNNGNTRSLALDGLESRFAELSDSMADLEANFMHLQLIHESLSRFGESFASFLYGLNMNAFVVDFPEQPLEASIQRKQNQHTDKDMGDITTMTSSNTSVRNDIDGSFVTGDTSFASMKATPRRRTMGAPSTPKTNSTVAVPAVGAQKGGGQTASRGASSTRAGRGNTRGTRGSGLPRGRVGGLR